MISGWRIGADRPREHLLGKLGGVADDGLGVIHHLSAKAKLPTHLPLGGGRVYQPHPPHRDRDLPLGWMARIGAALGVTLQDDQ